MIAAHASPDNSHNLTSLSDFEQSKQSDLDSTNILPPRSQLPITDVSLSPFERRSAEASLPPPGPSHYSARRQLWLAQTERIPLPPAPSTSRERLEELLSMPGAATNDEVWKAGVERVWRGLVTGGRLKRRLPMNLVIKIIHAGWLRDPETWPAGAVAPEPDDDMASPIFQPVTRVPTELSSGVTTPWQATTAIVDDAIPTSISRQASGLVGLGA